MFSDRNRIRIDINNREITWKPSNTCKLNNILSNNPRAQKEVSRKFWKMHTVKEKEHMTDQMLSNTAKTMLQGKFTALN